MQTPKSNTTFKNVASRPEFILHDPLNVRDMESVPFDLQMKSIKEDHKSLRWIANPYEETIMLALAEDGDNIKFIGNPTPEMMIAAVKQTGWAVDYIDNLTEDVCIACVQKEPMALFYIKPENQTERIVCAALAVNKEAKKFIKIPHTEAIVAELVLHELK